MVYNVENSKGLTLVDSHGIKIPFAFEFNEETSEVKFYVTGVLEGKTKVLSYGGELIRASAIIPGAKMERSDCRDGRCSHPEHQGPVS